MMWRWLAIGLLVAAPAFAADRPLNGFIVPTAPVGTSNNQAASTAFVAGQIAANARIRLKLSAPLTLNSDTGSGINQAGCGLGTGASACNTLNYLINNIFVPNYDTAGQAVTLSFVANDSTCISRGTAWTGGGQVTIQGPGGSPPSVGLTCATSAVGINAPLPAMPCS